MERATTQPSLFPNTQTGLFHNSGLSFCSHETKKESQSTTPNGQVNNSCNYVLPATQIPSPQIPQQIPVQQPKVEPIQKPEPKQELKTKKVTVLTDELIQSIENYLRNPNKEIRKQGAKKLIALFNEDESRKNDIALTNLLNLMLQDKDQTISLLGVSAINQGLAQGDSLTEAIINQLSNTQTKYGVQETLASSAALNMLGQQVEVEAN